MVPPLLPMPRTRRAPSSGSMLNFSARSGTTTRACALQSANWRPPLHWAFVGFVWLLLHCIKAKFNKNMVECSLAAFAEPFQGHTCWPDFVLENAKSRPSQPDGFGGFQSWSEMDRLLGKEIIALGSFVQFFRDSIVNISLKRDSGSVLKTPSVVANRVPLTFKETKSCFCHWFTDFTFSFSCPINFCAEAT